MKNVLITGGAGFVGSNLAHRLLKMGSRVTVYDSLIRPGTENNLNWLRGQYGDQLHYINGDVRDAAKLSGAVEGKDAVFHYAAQVAVTSSVIDPRADFEINALGTLNVLEAIRAQERRPVLLFSSTNKVYGGLEGVPLEETPTRWRFADGRVGVTEEQPLDFHSPYGCSKGAADQYVRDYARMFDLKTVVFRMSCIYGPRQFGNEDQGWVAHFLICALFNRPITIYGDGKQVRDILHIDDLLDAYCAAYERIDSVSGQVFNIGGGPDNTVAIWTEFGDLIERATGRRPLVDHGAERPGDQAIYVSGITKAASLLGWRPRIGIEQGVQHLVSWIKANATLFGDAASSLPVAAASSAS